jgi:5-methylcytosine-specific restriction endonuclease McrA
MTRLNRGGLSRGGLARNPQPINVVGRISRYRQERRKQWIKDHPPNEFGFWICYLCNKPVHISIMKLDHRLPKGSTPKALAEADANLWPTHKKCNDEKGSTRLND